MLGATGFLGTRLVPKLRNSGHVVVTHGRTGGDYRTPLGCPEQTHKLLDEINPDVILSLVGLTNVDLCENDPHQAYLDNVRPIENISSWLSISSRPSHLIYISTDQVYDGLGPHAEDEVKLTNYDAFSKYSGEMAALRSGGTILRTNFIGKSNLENSRGLSDWLHGALLRGEMIRVFDDIKFSPISIASLLEIIEIFVQKKGNGIFNVGSRDGFSKADFAYAFAKELDISNLLMKRVDSEKVNFFCAYRPKDMRMNCLKLEEFLGIKVPSLTEEIEKVAKEYL